MEMSIGDTVIDIAQTELNNYLTEKLFGSVDDNVYNYKVDMQNVNDVVAMYFVYALFMALGLAFSIKVVHIAISALLGGDKIKFD